MSDNAGWARGMPWRLIGVGAAFISSLFAWHLQRDMPQAMAGELALGTHTALGEDTAALVLSEAPPKNRPRTRPAVVTPTPKNEELTAEINTSSTSLVEQSTLVVVPAEPPPPRIVVLVHEAAPPVAVPRPRWVTGGFSMPNNIPRRPALVPRTPNVTRSGRLSPPAARRASVQRSGVGTPSTTRRTPSSAIPRR